MDLLLALKAAIMGVVEGLTEFLPISSTGHLILAGSLLDFTGERAKVFEIAIQTGAILAVIIVYWQKIRDTVVALKATGVATVLVEQRVDAALAASDTIAFIEGGTIAETAAARALTRDAPQFAAYAGI